MELHLSRNNPANTSLTTSDGRVLYSVSTPRALTGRTTTLSKHNLSQGGCMPVGGSHELARIHWHRWRHAELVYNDQILDCEAFCHKDGTFSRSRSFTGPDGRSYKWKSSWRTSRLELDGSTVATVQSRNLLGTEASFEIDASALHMLDLIVVTWVYYEKKKRQGRSNNAAAASAGGAAAC